MPYMNAKDGVDLYYTDQGEGTAIFLISGWTFSHAVFRQNTPVLAETNRVVTMDLRGHGHSGKEPRNWSLRQSARDTRSLIEHLGLTDVTVVGWSMGTTVIHNYVEEFGADRLSGAVFVDMTPNVVQEPDWAHTPFGTLDHKGAIEVLRDTFENRPALINALIPAFFKDGQGPDDETKDWFLRDSMLTPTAAMAAFWISMVAYDWRPQLQTFPLPVLLCYGARSAVYPTDLARHLEKEIPDSHLIVFEESGHSPFWEEPDKFNSEVARFAAEVAGRDPGA